MNPAENYILKQPEPYQSILLQLQILIETTVPKAELLYKWKLPFYYYEGKPFCYLNVTKGYVDLGFWGGKHLSEFDHHLVSENRKVMKSLRYFSVDEIDGEILIRILQKIEEVADKGFSKNR